MQCLEILLLIFAVRGMEKLPSSESYVDRKSGESGRYYGNATSKLSGNNYLCHYGKASSFHETKFFSDQCFLRNKDILTDRENKSKIYPYFLPPVGSPPGCGSLPNVSGGEWVCPDGVSPSSVPVYERCRLRCLNQPSRNNSIKVRCTEKLDWDYTLSSAICSTESPSVENLETIIISTVGVIVPILFLWALLTYRCNKIRQNPSRNFPLTDNAHTLFDRVSADGDNNDDAKDQNCLINKVAVTESSRSNSDTEVEKESSTETNRASEETRPSCTVLFQQSNSSSDLLNRATEASVESSDLHKINCCSNEVNSLSPLSPFGISNDKFVPLDKASLENSEDVRENVAFIECHPEKSNYALPEILQKSGSDPCPTFAAMLEGALDDSVRFVDDLSTLLDLDVQYKSPRNWQGLAQTLFNLSYNKIMEIRHKTKDHFRDGVLPLLSCYGYRIYDVTYYFYSSPSRRVDVLECIQRYHPHCQHCEEIYTRHKSDILSNAS